MASEADDAPLVGRTGTLAAIGSDLLDVGPGGTAAVFVTGESGVGKTRLLREAAEAMRRGRRGRARRRLPGHRRRLPAASGAAGAAPPRPGVHGGRRRGATPARCSSGCPASCARWPATGRLLLVLDDLQWADRSTRQLLLYLLAGLGDCGCRCSPRSAPSRCRAPTRCAGCSPSCAGCARCGCVDLAPLDRDATRELVTAIAGAPVRAGGRRPGLQAQRRQPVRRRGAGPRPARRPGRAVRHAARDLPVPGGRAAAARARRGARGRRRRRAGRARGAGPGRCRCPRTS